MKRKTLLLLAAALLLALAACAPALAEAGAGTRGMGTITVHFIDTLNWGTPNIYYWNNGPAYPGTAMTADGTLNGYNLYKATIPAGTVGIIFNNNGKQTTDITTGIADGATWYATIEKEGNYYKAALYTGSGSGSGESGETITVYLVDDVPDGYHTDYFVSYSTDGGSHFTNHVQMERDGTGSNNLPRYKVDIPASTTNIAIEYYNDNYGFYDVAGSFSSGITDGATWKMTYNQDEWKCVASALVAPAVTPAPITAVSPEGAGTITEVIPAPMPTDSAYDPYSPPAHAFKVEENDGYEVDTVVYQFDQNAAQSLIYASGEAADGTYGRYWYIKESAIPASGYESLTVTANFAQAYTISVPDDDIIIVRVEEDYRNYSKAGNTILLAFKVEDIPEGYLTDKLIVTPEDGDALEVSMARNDNTDYYRGAFTMPAAHVTVSYKPIGYGLYTTIMEKATSASA